MPLFKDVHNRSISLSDDRQQHIETDHPEMTKQIDKVQETLKEPDIIVRSRTDQKVELFYKHYKTTPVTEKYLCVVTKISEDGLLIITAYFTDSIKKGDLLWQRK